MVKGVNKNIIEINDTGSAYFERAILFVRQNAGERDPDKLRARAGEFLSGLKVRFWWRPKNEALFRLLRLICAAGIGAAVACALLIR